MLSEGGKNQSSKMSFRITKDDRFFSRLMAKEATTTPNSSSRILYYGQTSVAVPFTWEAQPGTPKHPLSETSLPPLTPPPSYFSNSHNAKGRSSKPNNNMFSTLLPRLVGPRKSHHESPPTSSRSPSSSSSSSSSSCSFPYHSSSFPSFSMRDKDPGQQGRSPSFSHPFKHKCSNGFTGCYPFGNIIGNVNDAKK